jgi:hypothetical protein
MDRLDYPFELYTTQQHNMLVNSNVKPLNPQRIINPKLKIVIYGSRKINKDLIYNNNNDAK